MMPQDQMPDPQSQTLPSENIATIELRINLADGTMAVGMGGDEDQPVASIQDALKLIGQLASQVSSQSPEDQQVERAAYEQEMGAPTM